jgi:hypothetical protein
MWIAKIIVGSSHCLLYLMNKLVLIRPHQVL